MTGENNDKPLGERVRTLRRARRLTQKQLAARAGISENYVFRIEMGTRTHIRAEALTSIAQALGVPVDDLIGPTQLPEIPAPWLLALGARLDALPPQLSARVQALIEELVAVVETPVMDAALTLTELLGETTELSEAELAEVAAFALDLVHQQAKPSANVSERADAG